MNENLPDVESDYSDKICVPSNARANLLGEW